MGVIMNYKIKFCLIFSSLLLAGTVYAGYTPWYGGCPPLAQNRDYICTDLRTIPVDAVASTEYTIDFNAYQPGSSRSYSAVNCTDPESPSCSYPSVQYGETSYSEGTLPADTACGTPGLPYRLYSVTVPSPDSCGAVYEKKLVVGVVECPDGQNYDVNIGRCIEEPGADCGARSGEKFYRFSKVNAYDDNTAQGCISYLETEEITVCCDDVGSVDQIDMASGVLPEGCEGNKTGGVQTGNEAVGNPVDTSGGSDPWFKHSEDYADWAWTYNYLKDKRCKWLAETPNNDIDNDNIPDQFDDDLDNDGKKNWEDDDIDGDGKLNGDDDDVDGDGVSNAYDDDIDGDGDKNELDDDMDGDGIPNSQDSDIDGDGIPNDQDPTPYGSKDSDEDGVPDDQQTEEEPPDNEDYDDSNHAGIYSNQTFSGVPDQSELSVPETQIQNLASIDIQSQDCIWTISGDTGINGHILNEQVNLCDWQPYLEMMGYGLLGLCGIKAIFIALG